MRSDLGKISIICVCYIWVVVMIGTVKGSCDEGWVPDKDKCYLFVNGTQKTFVDAQRYCEQQNSELLKIESQEENTFIKNILNMGTYIWDVWLPLCNSWPGENIWCWEDDSAGPEFFDWQTDFQPDYDPNDYNVIGVTKVCSRLIKGFSWTWGDKLDWQTANLEFICEKPNTKVSRKADLQREEEFYQIEKGAIRSCDKSDTIALQSDADVMDCSMECLQKTPCYCAAFNLIIYGGNQQTTCELIPHGDSCTSVPHPQGQVWKRSKK